MDRKHVRWGVISTANIGRVAMIPALQASGSGEVLAVASRSEEKALTFAGPLAIPRAYGSYEALLADPEIDAVYIPLPNSLHREWCIRSAEAGKHILCEKPLGLDAGEVEEMAAAARANGVLLLESFMYRFHPQHDRVRALIHDGAIGEPRLIHSSFTFRATDPANIRWSADLGGGALMDVGCYCVNVSRMLAGAEPEEVQAYATWADSGVDSQMVGTLRFPSGLVAQFDCALNLQRRESYQVVGTDGAIEAPVAFLPGRDMTTLRILHGRSDAATETIPGIDEYRVIGEHFARCILDGEPVRYPPEEAAANLRTMAALYRSARHGGRPEPVI